MGNDRIFVVYAALLVSGIVTMLTAVALSGVAAVPAPLFLVEHLGLALLFRASYKSLAGPGWAFGQYKAEDAPETPDGATVGAVG